MTHKNKALLVVDENDPSTYVVCPECKKKYIKLVHWHIKKHGYSVEEFEKKHNITSKDRISEKLRQSTKFTKDIAYRLYGPEEGQKRWDAYREKQAVSNTFEYKQQKYGWTREQFDEYNQNRACTEENFIKRNGEEKGKDKWKEYCNLQKYVGSSEAYFIDKCGDAEGRDKWKEVCKQKKNTLKNFIRRYGDEEGPKRYLQYITDRSNMFSKISQELFDVIIDDVDCEKVKYANHGGEYFLYDHNHSVVRFYDYVDMRTKKCIEFHGDVFHANPALYLEHSTPNPYLTTVTAAEIWEKDKQKQDLLKQNGFELLVIWESEYKKNPKQIIKSCKEFLYESKL